MPNSEQQAVAAILRLKDKKQKSRWQRKTVQFSARLGARVCIEADTIIVEQIVSRNEMVETTEPLTFGCDDA